MNEKIMVVDDDPASLVLTEIMLKRKGFTVLKASDASKALDLLAGASPDLFILDVMMPGINGLELCQQLRSRPDTAQIPVLMLSAWLDSDSIKRGIAAGANAYLGKTSPPSKLLGTVQTLLSYRSNEQRLVS